jgi:hypothetical protein
MGWRNSSKEYDRGDALGVREVVPTTNPLPCPSTRVCRRLQILFRTRISARRHAPTQVIEGPANRYPVQKSAADRRPISWRGRQIHTARCGHIYLRAALFSRFRLAHPGADTLDADEHTDRNTSQGVHQGNARRMWCVPSSASAFRVLSCRCAACATHCVLFPQRY